MFLRFLGLVNSGWEMLGPLDVLLKQGVPKFWSESCDTDHRGQLDCQLILVTCHVARLRRVDRFRPASLRSPWGRVA